MIKLKQIKNLHKPPLLRKHTIMIELKNKESLEIPNAKRVQDNDTNKDQSIDSIKCPKKVQ